MNIQRDQQMSLRQEAFRALLESLRKDARPARKPAATAVELPPAEETAVELECEDCGGSGFDSGSLDPSGEICSHCMGSGKEFGAPVVMRHRRTA